MTTDMLASPANLFIKFFSGEGRLVLAQAPERVAHVLHNRLLWRIPCTLEIVQQRCVPAFYFAR